MAATRYRTAVLALVKLVFLCLSHLPSLHAAPVDNPMFKFFKAEEDPTPKPADDPSLWVYLGTAVALVLLGGAFAGLTIAYVSQIRLHAEWELTVAAPD